MDFERGPARVAGMGLFESTALGLCSIDDGAGDGGGGGGGGGDLGGAAAALAGGGDGDAGGGGARGGDGGAGGGGADPDFLEHFSAEGGDAENPSNRDWMKAKGFKSLDDVAKSYRETEKAFHTKGGGGITAPGADAKPEEIAAYHKAIGVPENVEGYAFDMPEGVKEDELDMPLLGSIKEKALAAGVPASGFKSLVEGVIAAQLDELAGSKKAEDDAREALYKEWGAQKDAKLADVQNAARALGLSAVDVAAMQRGFAMQYREPGTKRTLELLQKLGAGLAEDTLLGGDGPKRFGVTGEQAQVEINRLTVDPEFQTKLTNKEPDAVARWTRLNEAVAADLDRKQRAMG